MKKYVRTEDHIYEIKIDEDAKNNNVVNYFYCEEHFDDNVVWLLFEEEELKQYKQADTIEDLCDEFVVAYEDGARIVYGDLEWATTKAKASLEFGNKSIIYGAIWTEWGLKYVAKYNKDGVLELI